MSLSTPTTDGGHVESFIDVSSGFNVLHAQKFDAAGHKVGAELVLNSAVIGPYDVAAVAGGGYVLIYQSGGHGTWGEIRIQDATGATVASTSTAAGQDFHLVAGQGGGFLVAYHGTELDHGLDGSQPLLQLYDAAGHSLTAGHIELAGQIAGITAQAGGVMAVDWNDGGTIHTLTLDPHTAASPSTPAMPAVTVLDDVGAVTGPVANGATTDDATPTFRIAVTQVGEAFVELDKDTGATTYHNQGGGIAVTAADVARGYIDITLPTSGDGHYMAWARVTDATGSASYPVAVNFTEQAPTASTGTAGQVLTAQHADATLMGGVGDDTVTGGAGSNYLRGGEGNDSIVGGAGFNDINGNQGDDTIVGGSAVGDWLVGGQGNDMITAHGGGNIVYGNLGNDTLVGGTGGDILRGGQGDDSIVAGSGAEWISGDRGDDTIQGGAGPDTFHTFSGAGMDRVLGFDAAKGDHVMIDPGTAYSVSQVGADTVIDLGHGDQMVLVGVSAGSLPSGWIV
ncbi:calcium-binding protein [Phenylobacterium sp.]|uniref:calcium-binding protein n=1 Tax=Phenylobacterium sp. TaxID=1871053 RepID=UPI002DF1ED97|nr:calcium-binding protein [Phenylobacterium sp.]